MSLHDRNSGNFERSLRLLACSLAAIALGATSACTVKPLYSDTTAAINDGTTPVSALGSIAVNPVNNRYGKELRNHLIFMLNGGGGQPADPAYTMTLTVSAYNQSAASIQVNNEDRPTAGLVEMSASYTLKDTATGEVVVKGDRKVSSSYDRSSQEFAALRAIRDAENRAARELAEFIRLDVGQRMATRS